MLIELKQGTDLTELLGVIKYEPPMDVSLSGIVKGVKPSLISKTDQERIQNLLGHIEKYKEMEFEVTEKLDGTSAQFYYNGGEFGVCSRNLEYKLEDKNNAFVRMADGLRLEEHLAKLGRNVSLQGELVGERIQKNYLKILGQRFYVFDVWDIDKQCYMPPIERREFLAQLDGVTHVPTPCLRIRLFEEYGSMDKLLEFAKGRSMINPQAEREGVVCRSYAKDEYGNLISFKIINNDYLLRHEE